MLPATPLNPDDYVTKGSEKLSFGEIDRALHVVIDIQRLFTASTDWQVGTIPAILSPVKKLIEHHPEATCFARFITPHRPEDAQGVWQGYYRHWSTVTGDHLAVGMIDVLPELVHAAPSAPVIDKTGYSVFSSPAFLPLLEKRGISTLILSGVETDVCVLSTVMQAVDLGLRVIVARDAVTGGSPEGHNAALEILRLRFDRQVEIADTSQIIENWATS
ncbi:MULTISPECIES: cysteine hydrolase family protein [Pacificibacter]|uniref:cysteine hydrolase family protein n=1 Tax=Pacificibacter TaxID=1042323 RepID=UPI001C0865C1|nr:MULTISPECIES: cysteine hydrolase [Pacificibacter]MBU2935214.1 cysteine hydrolase [Pacificibacter marinus]MDO6616007.1 cysteine hydrolase [Pacificibacter sp. 1_MG-2023]